MGVVVVVVHSPIMQNTHTPQPQLGAVDGVAGQAFFVTNDAPLPFWDFLAAVLTGFGYPVPRCAFLFFSFFWGGGMCIRVGMGRGA